MVMFCSVAKNGEVLMISMLLFIITHVRNYFAIISLAGVGNLIRKYRSNVSLFYQPSVLCCLLFRFAIVYFIFHTCSCNYLCSHDHLWVVLGWDIISVTVGVVTCFDLCSWRMVDSFQQFKIKETRTHNIFVIIIAHTCIWWWWWMNNVHQKPFCSLSGATLYAKRLHNIIR